MGQACCNLVRSDPDAEQISVDVKPGAARSPTGTNGIVPTADGPYGTSSGVFTTGGTAAGAPPAPGTNASYQQVTATMANAKYEERRFPVGTYKGQIVNGKRHGYGECLYDAGPHYKGNWLHDRCHGDGIFIDNDSRYSGQWRMGRKHGFGEEVWHDDGTKYLGEHTDGNKHGRGQYVWADGSSYEGEFRNDVVEGYGVLRDKQGGVYTGQFVDNMRRRNFWMEVSCRRFLRKWFPLGLGGKWIGGIEDK